MHFIYQDETEFGPYPVADIHAMVASGKVSREALFREESSEEWIPFSELPKPVKIAPTKAGWNPGKKEHARPKTGKIMLLFVVAIVALLALAWLALNIPNYQRRSRLHEEAVTIAQVLEGEIQAGKPVALEKCIGLTRADLHRILGAPESSSTRHFAAQDVPVNHYENGQLDFSCHEFDIVTSIHFHEEEGKPPVSGRFSVAGVPLKARAPEWEARLGPGTPRPDQPGLCLEWKVDGIDIKLNYVLPEDAGASRPFWWVSIARY